jgi:hypothetical protein
MDVDESNQEDEALALHGIYVIELREHALALIWLGYRRIRVRDFVTAEEDAITGELVRQMKSTIEDNDAPTWTQHYSVSEQVRSDAKGKLGKHRPIVDVELERHKRGKRPRLRFEAKRLYAGSGVTDYVGADGLGSFLDGYYSRTHDEAGMLGYVQTRTDDYWAGKLGAKLIAPSCRIITGGDWKHLRIVAALPHTYQTIHSDLDGLPLFIFHVLLSFVSHEPTTELTTDVRNLASQDGITGERSPREVKL